jgi:hypothetical protein
MKGAVVNFLTANAIRGAEEMSLDWVGRLMRDCAREAMTIAQIAISTANPDQIELRRAKLINRRDQRLARARAELYPAAQNFESFVRWVQRHSAEGLQGPVQKAILATFGSDEAQISLMGPDSDKQRVLLDALKADALCYPPNTEWRPFELPTTLELAPLLAWNGENDAWIR